MHLTTFKRPDNNRKCRLHPSVFTLPLHIHPNIHLSIFTPHYSPPPYSPPLFTPSIFTTLHIHPSIFTPFIFTPPYSPPYIHPLHIHPFHIHPCIFTSSKFTPNAPPPLPHCIVGWMDPSVRRMTDRCKSITFPQLRLRQINIWNWKMLTWITVN